MDEKTIKEFKKKLETEKIETEKELENFADRDKKLKGDWDARFPHWNGDSGGAALETAADEVEEYSRRLPLEHLLELRLKDINLALEKIKKGKYGVCEKCEKQITMERLKIYSAARFCKKCLDKD